MSERRTGSAAAGQGALNRAYAYQTQGSSALQELPLQRPSRLPEPIPVSQPQKAPKAKPQALPKPFNLGGILLIGVCFLVGGTILLAQMGQITAVQKTIAQYQSQIQDANVVSQTLQLRLVQAYSVSAVERTALEELGMQYPTPAQYRVVALPKVVPMPEPVEVPQQQSLWQWLMGFLQ